MTQSGTGDTSHSGGDPDGQSDVRCHRSLHLALHRFHRLTADRPTADRILMQMYGVQSTYVKRARIISVPFLHPFGAI